MYYFDNGTKNTSRRDYKTEDGVINAAVRFLKENPTQKVGIYEKRDGGVHLLGNVYYGRDKGRKVIRYKTKDEIRDINGDGTVKIRNNDRYIAVYYRQHGTFTDLNTARKEAVILSKKNDYDSVVICKNYIGDQHGMVWREGKDWYYENYWDGKGTYFNPITGKAIPKSKSNW